MVEPPLHSLSSPEDQLPMVSILGVSQCRPPPLNSDDSNASSAATDCEPAPVVVTNYDLRGGELKMPEHDELEYTASSELRSDDDD